MDQELASTENTVDECRLTDMGVRSLFTSASARACSGRPRAIQGGKPAGARGSSYARGRERKQHEIGKGKGVAARAD